jgi:hypothetical protein
LALGLLQRGIVARKAASDLSGFFGARTAEMRAIGGFYAMSLAGLGPMFLCSAHDAECCYPTDKHSYNHASGSLLVMALTP